jgi:effector-binding domain-containing protein
MTNKPFTNHLFHPMKVLKYILFILLGTAVLFILAALFARHDYHIERSIEIEAPREIVYDQVRFFKNAPNWSPWLYLDPNVKTSIEGPDGEAGTVYEWSGNKAIGTGSQTIKSVTPERIDLNVVMNDFSTSPAYFAFSTIGDTTKVIWSMDIRVPFPWNALSMLTDMNNSFIGKDFENGLGNLRKYCETLAPKKYRGYKVKETELPVIYYTGVRKVVDFDSIAQFLSENFSKVMEEARQTSEKMIGHPSGVYWTYDTLALKTDMAATIPLEKELKPAKEIEIAALGGRALVIEYVGDYAKTGEARGAMTDYMTAKKLQYVPPVIEEYITGPKEEPDTAKWLMRIIYFVKADTTAAKPL